MVEEKLKKITLKTLLINSPFDWKYLLSNKWRKLLNGVEKTSSKPTSKSCRKQPPKAPIYRARKTSRWGSGRPAGRPRPWNREQVSLPVDRPGRPGLSREQKLSGSRPGRSTGPPAKAGVHVCARRSTVPVDRLQARSTGLVDRQKPGHVIFGIKRLVILAQIKSHKIMKNLQKLF